MSKKDVKVFAAAAVSAVLLLSGCSSQVQLQDFEVSDIMSAEAGSEDAVFQFQSDEENISVKAVDTDQGKVYEIEYSGPGEQYSLKLSEEQADKLVSQLGGNKNMGGYMNSGITYVTQVEDHIQDYGLEAFRAIDVEISFSDFKIVQGDFYGIDIHNYTTDYFDAPIDYEVKDGAIIIKQAENKLGNKQYNNYSVQDYKSPKATLTVPAGVVIDSIKVKSSGDIAMPGIACQKLDIYNNYGAVDFEGCTADEANLAIAYGDGSMNGFDAGKLMLDIKYYDLKFENPSLIRYDSMDISSAYSDLTLINAETDTFNLETMYGDLHLQDLKAEKLVLTANYVDIEGSNLNFGQVDVKGMYSVLDVSRWQSASLNLAMNYSTVLLEGSLAGHNKISGIYNSVELRPSAGKEAYYLMLNVSIYDSVMVDGQSYKKTTGIGNADSLNSITIDCGYTSVAIDF